MYNLNIVFLIIVIISILSGGVCGQNVQDYIKGFVYRTEGRRDPFRPLPVPEEKKKVEAEKVSARKKETKKEKIKIPDVEIVGIIWSNDSPLVMFKGDDRIFKEGMSIDPEGKIRIRKINKDNIILERTEAGVTVTKKILLR